MHDYLQYTENAFDSSSSNFLFTSYAFSYSVSFLKDLHTLNLTHYSYGGAKITWSQMVKRMGNRPENKSDGVLRFENHISSKSGLKDPPQSYFTVSLR